MHEMTRKKVMRQSSVVLGVSWEWDYGTMNGTYGTMGMGRMGRMGRMKWDHGNGTME